MSDIKDTYEQKNKSSKSFLITLPVLIPVIVSVLGIAGWAVKTTVSEMLLAQEVKLLTDQRTVLRDNLRLCQEQNSKLIFPSASMDSSSTLPSSYWLDPELSGEAEPIDDDSDN